MERRLKWQHTQATSAGARGRLNTLHELKEIPECCLHQFVCISIGDIATRWISLEHIPQRVFNLMGQDMLEIMRHIVYKIFEALCHKMRCSCGLLQLPPEEVSGAIHGKLESEADEWDHRWKRVAIGFLVGSLSMTMKG